MYIFFTQNVKWTVSFAVYRAFDVMKIDLSIKHHGGWQVSFVFHFSEANLTTNITITDISNVHLNRSKNILVNNTQKIIHKDIILTTYRIQTEFEVSNGRVDVKSGK